MKILIIDDMHPSILPMLEKDGHLVDYRPDIKREEIFSIIGNYEGILIRSKTAMDQPLLEKATRLRFIGRAGAGLEKIDLQYLQSNNIRLFHAAEGNRDAVGEHALGMLLALFNHLLHADHEVRRGIWKREENRGEELKGKTVGIVGFGNMGSAFAEKLSGFSVRVLAYDRYKSGFGGSGAEEVSFEKMQEEVDILSLHVPLTPETRNWLTLDLMKKFRKPFFLINTARGEIVSFDTLNAALDSGLLRGVAMDVMENEKFLSFSKQQRDAFELLAARENVIFTPHIAGWTHQSYERINRVLVDKVRAMDF